MVRELSLGKLGVLGFEVDHNATWLHVSANLVSSTKKVPVCGGYPNQRRTGYRARREPPAA